MATPIHTWATSEPPEARAEALHHLQVVERFTATRLHRARLTIHAFLAGALHQPAPETLPDDDLPALTSLDLERFAPLWAALVRDRSARDALTTLLMERYDIASLEPWPRLRAALGGAEAEAGAGQPDEQVGGGNAERWLPPDEGDLAHLTPIGHLTQGSRAYEALVRALELEMEWVQVGHGERLVRQGEASDSIYIVVDGRLRVTVSRPDGSEFFVGEVTRWETVGEMGIITGDSRSANVYAVRDTELLRLSKEAFDRLLTVVPEVSLAVSRVLVQRIRAIQSPIRRTGNTLRTVALVPLGERVALRELAERLTGALAAHGAALRLDAATVSERLPFSPLSAPARTGASFDPDDASTVAWLNDQEAQYRYIVYQADPGATAWTGRCIRQADCVLLVGHAGAPPAASETIERFLSTDSGGAATRRELVLVQADGGEARYGTDAWLSRFTFATHHHVRLGRADDVGRLARRLVGRARGLVLGGGGARGFAHIGVVRALEEAGIGIDLVGGSSAGAVIAAQIASGWDYREMRERTSDLIVRAKALVQYTVPFVSFLAARRFNEALETMFGLTRIEDLLLSYYCVSSNLTRADVAVHDRGSLVTYLRASCSLPGVFPPVLDNGELLADGVLLDNVPIDIMQGRNVGGDIIAVDVSSQIDLNQPYEFDHKLTGMQILLNRLNPFSRSRIEAPNIIGIMMRAAELGSIRTQLALAKQASLYINPHVSEFSTFDVTAFDRIVELGYEAAQRDLARWLETQ